MKPVRQLGSGLFYALVSVVLVVGGLSLALAEGRVPALATAAPSMSVAQTSEVTLLPSSTAISSTASPTIAPSATPLIISTLSVYQAFTSTPIIATVYYPLLPTSTTGFACGPYYGWVKAYTVQPGDTLFHVSTLYRTTISALEHANCKSNSTIFVGERLWVPNVPTSTPGATIMPTFTTATQVPTEPLTSTPLPFTATVIWTQTPMP